jgi:hypothetical protein
MVIQEDLLVARAERIVSEIKPQLVEEKDTASSGKTQASKAIQVFQTSRSLRVFLNWLRYQMSREEFWQVATANNKPLGQRIAEEVERISKDAQNKEDATNAILRFLGYFRRALVAVNYLDNIPPAILEVK